MWLLSRVESGSYQLTEFRDDDSLPQYAILSHTWIQRDDAEPTFRNLKEGTGQDKGGYEKIKFCGEQARRDGLKYFWVDTCCINKESHSELSHAIRSMFRWYRNSAVCYVYLSDVYDSSVRRSWDSEFYRSRWFTRGWTLQELLAPRSVEFFTCKGARLGSKITLAEHISEITRVPGLALSGDTLSRFSREERFRWSQSRETSRPEDGAYSLLGIFDVDMPVAYDEGAAGAIRRLEAAIERREKCIRDVRLSDPRDDKKRIEEEKGGLLKDAYCWVLQTTEFQQWHRTKDSSILWIKGDPGKGKTMLLCGMIEELEKFNGSIPVLSYFFCQATNRKADNATAVLRGLIYMFVHQWPSLVSHYQARHDTAGKALFEDVNAWVVLADVLRSMLADPLLDGAYVIVDALDECSTDRHKLLDFIVAASATCAKTKWIVASRNWSDVEMAFRSARQAVKLSLELNEDSVSAAVTTYIQYKVGELARRNRYDMAEQDAVHRNLECNAHGTFLWVALACRELLDVEGWEARKLSQELPPGLEPFYRRMIKQISHSKRSKLCKEILATALVVRRPLSLEEMSALVSEGPPYCSNPEAWVSIILDCGSFLVLREKIISFVHQSAKDFLFQQARSENVPDSIGRVHHNVCTRSLSLLMTTLRRNIYKLEDPGISIENVNPPHHSDPLAAIRYSCVYWVEHLQESMTGRDNSIFLHGGLVDKFLRAHYLYWLEASSLYGSMSNAQISMSKLEGLLREKASPEVCNTAHDALRFIMYHKLMIETFPLQVYMSGLLFSPRQSLIRLAYAHEEPEPETITIRPPVRDQWDACLQTLEGHSDSVNSVVFSHDSTRLASASSDGTIKIWEAGSYACLRTLRDHNNSVNSVVLPHSVNSVVFSHDSTRLASASSDGTIKIWEAGSYACLRTLRDHNNSVNSVVFSHDSTRLASASSDGTIKIWEAGSYACLRTLRDHNNSVNSVVLPHSVNSVVFSHDSTRLASASSDGTIKIWEAGSYACLRTLRNGKHRVDSVIFSHDSTRLASASGITIAIWDANNGACLETMEHHNGLVYAVTFSHDSTQLASGSQDKTLILLRAGKRGLVQTLDGHRGAIVSVAFSRDSSRLASGSADGAIKIWNANTDVSSEAPEGHEDGVSLVAFSHDSVKLASAAFNEIKIWDAPSGVCQHTLWGHENQIWSVDFSHDSARLASASDDDMIMVWDTSSDVCLRELNGHSAGVVSVKFSHDSTRLVSGSYDKTVKIWNARNGTCLRTLKGHSDTVFSAAFSHDSSWVVSASGDRTAKIWDVSNGACLQTLEGHDGRVIDVTFSHDSTRLQLTFNQGNTTIAWVTDSGAPFQATQPKAFNFKRPSDPQRGSRGVTSDEKWLKQGCRKILWLPSEFRPDCSAASGAMVAIGTASGKVWIYRLDCKDQ